MWCTAVDTAANTVTVSLRGLYGTTAAAHTTSSFVRNAPRFPRAAIIRAINDTIQAVYPDLYGVATTTLTVNSTLSIGYGLPAAVQEVLDVAYDVGDGTSFWPEANRYRVNLNANTTAFPTGKSIEIFDAIRPGATIQVVYKKQPSVLVNLADVFDTTTGLQESAKEAIVYGACSRLVGYLAPGRFDNQAAAAKLIGDGADAGDYLSMTRYFYQLHMMARAEEARRLNEKYPPRIHFTR